MQYYMEGKEYTDNVPKRADYINRLTRNQVSTIFKARTRMLKVKDNYKNGHDDLKCRLCGKEQESQKHILEEFEKLKDITPPITMDIIFQEEITELTKIYKMIDERMNELEKHNA